MKQEMIDSLTLNVAQKDIEIQTLLGILEVKDSVLKLAQHYLKESTFRITELKEEIRSLRSN
jgi:hypothetical protein